MSTPHRGRRLARRILLGLLALVALAIAGVVIFLHTDYGRGVVRTQVEAQLDKTFVGGASIGKVEGSPFGDLVLRDLVINGPDGEPVFTIGKVTLQIALLELASQEARITQLVVEDLVADLRRDANGELITKHLTRPGPKSKWSVELADITVKRAAVAYDTGSEVLHFDDLALTGRAAIPYERPITAALDATGTWREKRLPLALDVELEQQPARTSIARLVASAGELRVEGTGLEIRTDVPDQPPLFAGHLKVDASRAGVARLAPDVRLPGDVSLALIATPDDRTRTTHLELAGAIAGQQVAAAIDADLAARRGRGVVSAAELDLSKLTDGKVIARAGGLVVFDLRQGEPGQLPIGSAMIHAAGEYQDLPNTGLTMSVTSDGTRVGTRIGATNPGLTASLEADVEKLGDAITLERGQVVAVTTDPRAASGGAAPVRGRLAVNLTASGALSPEPSLAVRGRVDGQRLRVQDVAVDKLAFAIDARRLPARPLGRVELEAEGVQRQDIYLSELKLTAADRPDGRIAASIRTRPRQNPWLLDADALVTPGDVVAIDLVRHRIRAGSGRDWSGTSGRITIAEHRIDVRDLKSASADGALAISGAFHRSGRRKGDLAARIDAGAFKLATLADGYAGTLDARVDIVREAGRFRGAIDLDAQGIALDPDVIALDAKARIVAEADRLAIDARAGSPGLGTARLVLDVDGPKDITDAGAWTHLGRQAVRTGRFALERVNVAQVAELAGLEGRYEGYVDGDVLLTPRETGGVIRVRDLMVPQLRSTGKLSADLRLAQATRDELTPTLVARIGDIGAVTAHARIGVPEHAFEPAAWRALGTRALRHLTISADDLAIDPGQLDRLGIRTYARGKASFVVEVAEALSDARLRLALRTFRGSPIAQPIDVDVTSVIDGNGTRADVGIRTRRHERRGKEEVPVGPVVPLLAADVRIPLTIDEVLADPAAAAREPLQATARMQRVPAPHLLAVFARREVTGGTIDGLVELGGTVGKPTATARFAGSMIQVPPGPRDKPVKTLERIVLDATWDGSVAKLAIDGRQRDGMLRVDADLRPDRLADASLRLVAKQFDLVPVLAFAPGPAGGAAGRLDANLTMRGLDLRTARLAGTLRLQEGRIPIAPAVGTMQSANVDVRIGDRAIAVTLDGVLGRGQVKGKGSIGIEGAMPTGGDMTMTLRDVSPIGVVEPVIDADLTVKLRREPERWVADVGVRNGKVVVPDRRGEQLKPAGAPPDMVFMSGERMTERPMKKEPPERPVFVANLTIAPTFVESAEVRGILRGKLAITADTESVGIVGQIDADRGTLDLFGHRYAVERASVRFDGTTDPVLDVKITHEFPEVTTVTEIRGRLGDPDLVMSSNPGTYSQAQLLGFLLGGEPGGQPGDASDRATAAGTSFVANKIGGYIKDALPIDLDVLRYEAATANSSAAITVGTWLDENLFLAYRRRLDARPDENTGEGEVEYWLTRRLVIEGIIGDRNYNGVDLLWRRRY